jgi:hypothetical protein
MRRMVGHRSTTLGLLALLGALSCTDKDGTESSGTGGTSSGAGGTSGSGGTAATGGTAGKGGRGGAAGGGRAGSTTGGSTSTGGLGGLAGSVSGGDGGGSAGSDGEAGSSGASGEGGAANDSGITWDDAGFITASDNDFGIRGSWFFETDCAEAMPRGLPCTTPDVTLEGPDGRPGWSVSSEKVCVKGIAPQVIQDPMTTMLAYEAQWGARIGFELNGTGSAVRQPYNANAQGILGFTFDIVAQTTPAQPADVRVNFVTTGTTSDPHFQAVTLSSTNQTLLFSDAFQGAWVLTPVDLDTTELTAITFQISTNVVAARPFDFCISNVRVVQ